MGNCNSPSTRHGDVTFSVNSTKATIENQTDDPIHVSFVRAGRGVKVQTIDAGEKDSTPADKSVLDGVDYHVTVRDDKGNVIVSWKLSGQWNGWDGQLFIGRVF